MKPKEMIKMCLAAIAICVMSCIGTIYFIQYSKPTAANAAFLSDGENAIIAELREINKTLKDMRGTQVKIWEPIYSGHNNVFEKVMAATAKAINSQEKTPSIPAITYYR